MITTLTPNPSIDRTVPVASLVPGAVLRTSSATNEAAGKGVNVAGALLGQGFEATAIVPCSEVGGFVDLLKSQKIQHAIVQTGAPVRINISVIEDDGRTTKLNEPGATLTDEVVESLLATAEVFAARSSWFIGSGSLAPGMPADFYLQLAQRVGRSSARLAIDASGDALAAVLHHPGVTLKPNLEELSEVWIEPLTSLDAGVLAAEQLVREGAESVLLSAGPDGAALITRSGTLRGYADTDEVVNTVGAGDSLLAGYAAGMTKSDGDHSAALREALAWGRAAVGHAGTGFDTVDDADYSAVVLEPAKGASHG